MIHHYRRLTAVVLAPAATLVLAFPAAAQASASFPRNGCPIRASVALTKTKSDVNNKLTFTNVNCNLSVSGVTLTLSDYQNGTLSDQISRTDKTGASMTFSFLSACKVGVAFQAKAVASSPVYGTETSYSAVLTPTSC